VVAARRCPGRALGSFKNLLSVARVRAGLEILGHGHQLQDAPLLHASPFSSVGDTHNKGMSCISLKREMSS
jgi:hypothetical protein